RRRFSIEAFPRLFARNGQVRVIADGAELYAEQIPLIPVDPERFLIGVISSDPVLLTSLSSLQLRGSTGAVVQHMPADALPEHAALLRGLNALFLHDVDTGQLTAAQREALRLWVLLGGQLVVGGGLPGEQAAAGLADLLPVQLTGGVT